MMGIGTSVIFPLAMSAAAQLTDRPAPTNVASLAQISFVAFLLGPPLLGYMETTYSIEFMRLAEPLFRRSSNHQPFMSPDP
jgi:MFS family permease